MAALSMTMTRASPVVVNRRLKTIAERYPDQIEKEELGDITEFTIGGDTFNTYLSELKRNSLIEVNGEGFRATKELFLEN